MAGMVEGKVALITGAGSGIGRASALLYAREGAKGVVVADVNVEGGEETCDMIEKAGGNAVFVRTDVTKVEDVQNAVRTAVEKYGKLDCGNNIAGISSVGSVTETTEEGWNKVIGIDLTGVWRCMKYEAGQMIKQGGGTIVNMASMAGVIAFPGSAAYTAAKAGVINLTREAALDLARQGIRVNSVCPGVIRTPMVTSSKEAMQMVEQSEYIIPLGRIGEPEEIAEAVVWLSSDRSSFVTGEHLVVDGGYTIQ